VPENKAIKEITDPVIEPSHKKKGPHESQRIVELLNPIIKSKEQLTLPSVYFKPSQTWLKEAQLFLTTHQLKKGQYIVFGLGARREKKQASKEQIIETAMYAFKKHKLKTILVWTPGNKSNHNYPGDDELAYDILASAPEEIVPLRAPLDLTIGVIWLAKKSIFPDSGLMHFASASPGGVVGLFAETKVSPHPEQWGPLGRKSSYIEAKKSIKELCICFLHKEISRL
jgi:ADP-heptose:LPS heptosyltransferase